LPGCLNYKEVALYSTFSKLKYGSSKLKSVLSHYLSIFRFSESSNSCHGKGGKKITREKDGSIFERQIQLQK